MAHSIFAECGNRRESGLTMRVEAVREGHAQAHGGGGAFGIGKRHRALPRQARKRQQSDPAFRREGAPPRATCSIGAMAGWGGRRDRCRPHLNRPHVARLHRPRRHLRFAQGAKSPAEPHSRGGAGRAYGTWRQAGRYSSSESGVQGMSKLTATFSQVILPAYVLTAETIDGRAAHASSRPAAAIESP